MKTQVCYGIFAPPIFPSLTTPDKQLHVGPTLIDDIDSHWERIANTLEFLEENCPDLPFTVVLDDTWAFNNPDVRTWGHHNGPIMKGC